MLRRQYFIRSPAFGAGLEDLRPVTIGETLGDVAGGAGRPEALRSEAHSHHGGRAVRVSEPGLQPQSQ